MQQFNEDAFFAHYGIKGMRWGVRRKNSSGAKTPAQTASTLTDKELKKRVKRLNMEKQYVELVAGKKERERSSISKGARSINKALTKISTDIMKDQVKKIGIEIADTMIKEGRKKATKRG